jgi:hypothetical protein
MRKSKRGETIPSRAADKTSPNNADKKKTGQQPGSMHIDKRAGRLLADPLSEGEDDQMLAAPKVAEWLQVSVKFLEDQRSRTTGPPFVKYSERMVRYRREAVRAWLRRREQLSTRRKP